MSDCMIRTVCIYGAPYAYICIIRMRDHMRPHTVSLQGYITRVTPRSALYLVGIQLYILNDCAGKDVNCWSY